MKILIDGRVLTHKFPTGVQVYTKELLKAFDKMNVKYEISYPPSSNRFIHHLWEHSYLPHKSKKYDLLFCPGNIAPFWKFHTTKLVTTVHDLSFLYFPNYYAYSFRAYYKKMIPRVVKISDKIITVSKSEKKRIQKLFPKSLKKVEAIPLGLRKKFRNVKLKFEKGNYILYVGSLNPRKNFEGVIKAFQKIVHRIPHQLKIVGAGFKIFKKVKPVSSERIQFLGYVDEDYLIKLYSNCSLFVFPSYYEAFGLPVLEAMACGAPVITSNTSSLPEIAGDAAILVNPYDVDELAKAMLSVIENKDLRNTLIKKGYERAKKFSWEETAKKTFKVFEEVLSEN